MATGSGCSYNQKAQKLHGAWLLIFLILFQFSAAAGANRLTGYRPIEKYNGIDDNGVFTILSEYTFSTVTFSTTLTG